MGHSTVINDSWKTVNWSDVVTCEKVGGSTLPENKEIEDRGVENGEWWRTDTTSE